MSIKTITIIRYIFAVMIVVAAYCLYIADSQELFFTLPPSIALYFSLSLFTLKGVVIGAIATWLICRRQNTQVGGDHAS